MANEFGELPHIKYSAPEDPTTRAKTVLAVKRALVTISTANTRVERALGGYSHNSRYSLSLLERGVGSIYTTDTWQRILSGEASLYEIVTDVDGQQALRPDISTASKTQALGHYSHRQAVLRSILPKTAKEAYKKPLATLISDSGQEEFDSAPITTPDSFVKNKPGLEVDKSHITRSKWGWEVDETHYRVCIPTEIEGWNYWVRVVAGNVRERHGRLEEHLSTEYFYKDSLW